MEKDRIHARQRARKLVIQALYQWTMSGQALSDIEVEFHDNNNMQKVDAAYFHRLLHEVVEHIDDLEKTLLPFLDRDIATLNLVERCVLRLGVFELCYCPDIPHKIILDEAVRLTKEFGAQEGYRYVNGVLHQVAQVVRN